MLRMAFGGVRRLIDAVARRGPRIALAAAAALAVAGGCDKTAKDAAGPVPAVSVDRSSPEALARGFLKLTMGEMEAVAKHDVPRIKAARLAAAGLVARAIIEKELARSDRYQNKVDEAQAFLAQTWMSIASHDAARVSLDSLETRAGANPQSATVLAKLPQGGVSMRIDCRADAAGQWSIAGVDFERRRSGAGGTGSAPASAGAAAGSAPATPAPQATAPAGGAASHPSP